MAEVAPGKHQRWTLDRAKLVIGIVLFVFTAVTAYDAYNMTFRAAYGINPNTASYLVAVFFALLGIGHFWSATQPSDEAELVEADWPAILMIALGLFSLVGCIFLGGGFIAGSTLLFALTARAFGRHAIIIDLLIGLVVSTLIFLLFNKLLSLSLPQGPLERLF